MSELTPEMIQAQDEARAALIRMRREGESFRERRDEVIRQARKTGLSLRAIGSDIGISHQQVANIIDEYEESEDQ